MAYVGRLQAPSPKPPTCHRFENYNTLCPRYKKSGNMGSVNPRHQMYRQQEDFFFVLCSPIHSSVVLNLLSFLGSSHRTDRPFLLFQFLLAKYVTGILMARVHLWSRNINLNLSFRYVHSVFKQRVLHC